MSTNAQRGRKIRKKKQSMLPFYIGIGAVAAIGLIFAVYAYMTRDTGEIPTVSGVQKTALSVPSGRNEQGYWYKGDPNAPVTVVEFADYQCPGCASFALGDAERLMADYIQTGRVRLVFHDFPLPQHAQARSAHTAAFCAGEQGEYWSMHDTLYKRQSEWAENRRAESFFAAYAQALGIEMGAFQQCQASGNFNSHIERAISDGLAVNVPATPSFTVDGRLVTRDQLFNEIEAALSAKGL
jgi:protein-disulfide isomerase